MIGNDQFQTLLSGGGNVVDESGSKIGSIGQVYLDDQTGEPQWVTVKTGLFGSSESFVPLADSTADGNDLRVRYGTDMVKDAPRVDADGHLSQGQEAELYRYYGLGYTESTVDSRVDTGVADQTVAYDTSGAETDDAMTRSEEHLQVGTQRVEAGRARLRKFVVTENVTRTVPVSHDEVRLMREPITDANRAASLDGPEITEAEHEVTLYAERAVTSTETVPVERVRLGTETVTATEQVTGEVRKEQIELDTDAAITRTNGTQADAADLDVTDVTTREDTTRL